MMWTISPEELTRLRQAVGLSSQGLAEFLHVSEATVANWEAGAVRVPFSQVRHVRWVLGFSARNQAIKAIDLPECEWSTKFEDRPEPETSEEQRRSEQEWSAHLATCRVCQEREVVKKRFPLVLPPQPLWFETLSILMGGWLPEWAEPSVPGALVFGIVGLVRDVRLTNVPGTWGTILDVVLVSMVGAAAGLAMGVFRYYRSRWKTRAV